LGRQSQTVTTERCDRLSLQVLLAVDNTPMFSY